MKSLERQLQVNLAVILVLVMALIWGVGLALPWFFAETQTLHSLDVSETPHHPQRFKWLFPFLAAGGITLILAIQSMVIRRTFRRLDAIRAGFGNWKQAMWQS